MGRKRDGSKSNRKAVGLGDLYCRFQEGNRDHEPFCGDEVDFTLVNVPRVRETLHSLHEDYYSLAKEKAKLIK